MKRAIVLQGGGSKGSYQIGAWKALRKLNIKYSIVCGTSIGALNGVFMVQNNYKTAINMWKNINYDYMFNKDYKSELEMLKDRIITKGGIDVSNLDNLINNYVHEKRFYRSHIDFGLVTVNSKNLKPLFLTKKDIPKEKLTDYLRASSNLYPFFTKKNIDGNDYIDGGYRDNIPINLAIEMGADEIIAIELADSIGITKKVKNKDVNIITIRTKSKLGSTINFKKSIVNRNINLGYNDTMKKFNKLDGDFFTFKRNHLHFNYLIYKNRFIKNLEIMLKNNNNKIIKKLLKTTNYQKFVNNENNSLEIKMNETIEYIGRCLNKDESIIYDIKHFNKDILKYFNEVITEEDNLITKGALLKLLNKLSKLELINYIYDNIKFNYKKQYNKIITLSILFPNEFLASVYLLSVDKCVFYE